MEMAALGKSLTKGCAAAIINLDLERWIWSLGVQ